MPSKNSFAKLKAKQAETPAAVIPSNDVPASTGNSSEGAPAKPKQMGRPKADPKKKRDYKITLSLTQEQGALIKEKAGLAGEATFLYDQLLKAEILTR